MKNIFKLSVLTSFLIILFACGNGEKSVSAKIEGLGNDTVIVIYIPFGEMYANGSFVKVEKDTVIAVNGRFGYTLSEGIDMVVKIEPLSLRQKRYNGMTYSSDAARIDLLVRSGEKNHIKGEVKNGFLRYDVSGSDYNRDFAIVRNSSAENYVTIDSIDTRIDYYRNDPAAPENQDDQIKALFKERDMLLEKVRETRFDYFKKNPDSDLAAYYLSGMPLETIYRYYGNLGENAKGGLFSEYLTERYKAAVMRVTANENKGKITPGAVAPDFTLKTPEGANLSLSDIKGKYVVLDFWGSWCYWCLQGVPRMKEYYTKYGNKVEYLGIACRDKEGDWKKAIAEYELPWPQVINDESGDLQKSVPVIYAVEAYPTKIIIDPEGKIVQSFRGEGDAFYNKLDELLK